jgi:hypothetical protein
MRAHFWRCAPKNGLCGAPLFAPAPADAVAAAHPSDPLRVAASPLSRIVITTNVCPGNNGAPCHNFRGLPIIAVISDVRSGNNGAAQNNSNNSPGKTAQPDKVRARHIT